jgi:hypothetical protein
VVVAMSGGVDSSVAASLVVERGDEAIGVTMNLAGASSRCCSLEDADDARRVADRLGMRFYVANYRERFQREVIEEFASAYLAGRTPIPCVACNQRFKFEYLLERAVVFGASAVASGHYARVDRDPETGLFRLRRAVDPRKDQTYFLFGLSQASSARSSFPLGEHDQERGARARAQARARHRGQAREPGDLLRARRRLRGRGRARAAGCAAGRGRDRRRRGPRARSPPRDPPLHGRASGAASGSRPRSALRHRARCRAQPRGGRRRARARGAGRAHRAGALDRGGAARVRHARAGEDPPPARGGTARLEPRGDGARALRRARARARAGSGRGVLPDDVVLGGGWIAGAAA